MSGLCRSDGKIYGSKGEEWPEGSGQSRMSHGPQQVMLAVLPRGSFAACPYLFAISLRCAGKPLDFAEYVGSLVPLFLKERLSSFYKERRVWLRETTLYRGHEH